MSDAWTLVMVVCGGIITIAGAAGVIWWLIKPRIQDWLEDAVLKPVRETHHQVTVNHHSSAEPTILDRLDTLTTIQREQGETQEAQGREFESLHANLGDLTELLQDHLRSQSD